MRHTEPTKSNERGATAPSSIDASPARSSRLRASRLRGLRSRGASDWLPAGGIVLSLVYYYAVPSPLLSLPGLLAFLALAWLRLDLALCLLPLTFPFWFVPKHVGGSVVFPLSEIALGVCVVAALTRAFVVPAADVSVVPMDLRRILDAALLRLRRAGPLVLIGVALLLAGTALGVLIARRPHEALRAFRWEVVEPLLYAALVLVYLRGRHVRQMVGAFLGAALLVAALAAVQVFWLHMTFLPVAQSNRLIAYATPAGGVPRATAFIFGSGNTLGAWMARTLPLALALALAPRGLPRRWWLLALVATLAYVPALLWSDSRGAGIAAALACAVVMVLSMPRLRWAVGVAGAGALAALAVLLANRAAVLNALLSGHSGSGEVRTLVWLAAWHMIRDHLLLGIGPDQFLYYYSNLYTAHPYWILHLNGQRTLAWTEPNLAQPHNLILDLWLSGGILALVGFAAVLAAFWRGCWRVCCATRVSVSPLPRGEGPGASSVPPAPRQPVPTELQPTSPAPAFQKRDSSPTPAPAGNGRDSTESAWRAAIALGLGASVLAGVLHGMVDSAYFEPDLALIFWWAIASLVIMASSLY